MLKEFLNAEPVRPHKFNDTIVGILPEFWEKLWYTNEVRNYRRPDILLFLLVSQKLVMAVPLWTGVSKKMESYKNFKNF